MDYSSIQVAILSGIDVHPILTELASIRLKPEKLTKINIVQERG